MSASPTTPDLEALISALAQRVAELEDHIGRSKDRRSAASPRPRMPSDEAAGTDRAVLRPLNRRRLLTGGAAVAAGGVGALLASAEPAAAASGDPFIAGEVNFASTDTSLSVFLDGQALSIINTATTVGASGLYCIVANTSGLHPTGAIIGETDTPTGNGVTGASWEWTGVYGVSGTGFGVVGACTSGPGVMGQSRGTAASDFFANGNGRIQQLLQGVTGAPTGTTNDYFAGEQIRDNNGQMWICVGDSQIADGSPTNAGTWQKVAAVAPGANGGSTNMLASPFRLYDSRPGQPAAITAPQQQIQPGSANALPLVANAAGGVPNGAIGVFGTITITNTNGAGYLTVYPTGVTAPNTSNVNWTASNQTVAASYTCALSSSGSMTVYSGGSGPTDVILDIAGYIY